MNYKMQNKFTYLNEDLYFQHEQPTIAESAITFAHD